MDRTELLQISIPNDLVNRMLRAEQPALDRTGPHDMVPTSDNYSRPRPTPIQQRPTISQMEDLVPDPVVLGPSYTTYRTLVKASFKAGGYCSFQKELLHPGQPGQTSG